MASSVITHEVSRNSLLDEMRAGDHYPAMIVTPKKVMMFFLAGLAAVFLSYTLVDSPLSEFVEGKHVRHELIQAKWSPLSSIQDSMTGRKSSWKQLLDWPPLASKISPLLLLFVPFVPKGRIRDVLLLVGVSIMLAFILKGDLKMIFGRDWPMPLEGGRPDQIRQHASSFHFFGGAGSRDLDSISSFPSGHAAIAFAMFLSIGMIFRRALPWCLLLASVESLLMVALNYHFLSDVLAGALLGTGCTLLIAFVLRLPEEAGVTGSP